MSVLPAMPDLSRTALFQELTPSERSQLVALMEPHEYLPGAVILAEGDRSRSLHLITRGHCSVEKHLGSGEKHSAAKSPDTRLQANDGNCQLAILSAGMLFGEMSFLSAAPHSATVTAVDRVFDWTLPRDLFDHFVQHHQQAGLAILRTLSEIMAERLRFLDAQFCLACEPQAAIAHHELDDCRSQLFQNWNF